MTVIQLPPVAILTLGPLQIRKGGEELVGYSQQRKLCGLLIYLADQRHVRRDVLSRMFWPDREPERAKRTLSQLVYEARRALGDDVLDSVGDEIAATDQLTCDTVDFETAVNANDPAGLALYRGSFLADYSLPDSNAIETWVDGRRAALARAHRKLRRSGLQLLIDAGDLDGALAMAQEWVQLDPFEDEAHHRVIELSNLTGARSSAIIHFEEYARRLKEELNVEPLDETTALVDRIRNEPTTTSVRETPGRRRTVEGIANNGRPLPHLSRSRRNLRLLAGVAVLVLIAVGVWLTGAKLLGPGLDHSVAVLPFENLTGDPKDEPFSDGMTEELINSLMQINNLRVAGRTGSFRFKNRAVTYKQIGDSLNVATIVEGSVRRSGRRIRVTARLINASTGYQLWSRGYDVEFKAIIAVQDEIARAITDALRVRLTGKEEARLTSAKPVNEAAYNYYLVGRYHLNRRTPNSVPKSIAYFDSAIAMDSNYAPAYSGLADAYVSMLGTVSFSTSTTLPRARAAARKAIALDPSLPEAHTSLGRVYAQEWNWAAAENEFKQAIAYSPNYPLAHFAYGILFANFGLYRQSVAQFEAANLLDPLQPTIHNSFAAMLVAARDYPRAIQESRRCLDLEPDLDACHHNLANGFEGLGVLDSALTHLNMAFEEAAENKKKLYLIRIAMLYAKMNRRSEATALLKDIETPTVSTDFRGALGAAYITLGDTARGLTLLEGAIADHQYTSPLQLGFAYWDPVRKSPRFAAVLKKLGLSQLAHVPMR
jgi:TolB-like protein/DNA-binding SARP family transcriptional activator/Tfp pilus assembly protein PilF